MQPPGEPGKFFRPSEGIAIHDLFQAGPNFCFLAGAADAPGLQVGAVFAIVAFGDLDKDVLALRQRHVTHGDGDLTTHGG